MWWITGSLLLCALLGIGLSQVPWRLRLSLQGRGDPSGTWAVAGGVELWPLVASAVAARGAPVQIDLRMLGRRLTPRPAPDPEPRASGGEWQRLQAGYARLDRWFDPVGLLGFALRERRRVRVRRLDIDVSYSFEDVALTGELLAALYVLSGVLPPPVALRQHYSWDSVDRAQLTIEGELLIFPVLAAIDAAGYAIRNLRFFRRPRAASRATEAT